MWLVRCNGRNITSILMFRALSAHLLHKNRPARIIKFYIYIYISKLLITNLLNDKVLSSTGAHSYRINGLYNIAVYIIVQIFNLYL